MGEDRRSGRWRPSTALALTVGLVSGFVVAAALLRRELRALVEQAVPYTRRRAQITSPVLIVNPRSGDGKAAQVGLVEAAQRAGITTVVLEPGDRLDQLAHKAIDDGADAVGMAGGDGSLAPVAAVAIERGVPFFCVPVGTRNHFALDLGLDRGNPLAALDALRGGDEILIDSAVAGGQVFLNNVSFGVYAQAVHRPGYRDEKDRTVAETLAEAASDVDKQAHLRYETPDDVTHQRAPLLIISNNRYQFSGPDYGRRVRLDTGRLGVLAVTRLPGEEHAATALLHETHGVQEWDATSYRIESDDPILAGRDGEAVQFDSPLDVAIRPESLRTLVPSGTRPGYVPKGEAVAARLLDVAHLGGMAED